MVLVGCPGAVQAEAASAQRDFDEAQRRRLAAAEAVGAEAQVGPGRLVPATRHNVDSKHLGNHPKVKGISRHKLTSLPCSHCTPRWRS